MEADLALAVVLLLGVGLVLGGGGVLWWTRARRTRVRSTPRSRAREARPGTFVKVVGRLGAREPVRAPVGDVDCVYYRLCVLEPDRDGEGWDEVFTETQYAEGCVVKDESGGIGFEPAGASFSFVEVHEHGSGGLLDLSPLVPDGVRSRYGHLLRDRDSRMLVREERLELGAPVVALGQVALVERGPVLVGGPRLKVYQGTEQEVLGYKDPDLVSWLMLASGVLMLVAGAAWLLDEPEPIPVVKDAPLRPLAPGRTSPRPE
jgi:hypothetical protein